MNNNFKELKLFMPDNDLRKRVEIMPFAYDNTSIHLQFCGWELVLLEDGTYFVNDTTGG